MSDQVAHDAVRDNVRAMYSKVAETNAVEDGEGGGCGDAGGGCCGPADAAAAASGCGAAGGCDPQDNGGAATCCGTNQDAAINAIISTRLGYTEDEMEAVPDGANMGLGCGNPAGIASLKAGETVLDLGSGGGFDCFLSARAVGETGQVIGVDMTPAMVSKARANAAKGNYSNVQFRLGEIEYLPVADATVDVVISNCVVNLSPDKVQVFDEVFRILKPGGRIAFSDVVATTELPEDMRKDAFLIGACIGGAMVISELEEILDGAGFVDVNVEPKDESREFISEWAPGRPVTDYVVSANITARKPGPSACCSGGAC